MYTNSVNESKSISNWLEKSVVKPTLVKIGVNTDFYHTARIQWCGNYKNFTLCVKGPTSHSIEKILYSQHPQADNRFVLFAYVDRINGAVQSMATITLNLFWTLLKQDSNLTYTNRNKIDGAIFRAIMFETVNSFVRNNTMWFGHFHRFI